MSGVKRNEPVKKERLKIINKKLKDSEKQYLYIDFFNRSKKMYSKIIQKLEVLYEVQDKEVLPVLPFESFYSSDLFLGKINETLQILEIINTSISSLRNLDQEVWCFFNIPDFEKKSDHYKQFTFMAINYIIDPFGITFTNKKVYKNLERHKKKLICLNEKKNKIREGESFFMVELEKNEIEQLGKGLELIIQRDMRSERQTIQKIREGSMIEELFNFGAAKSKGKKRSVRRIFKHFSTAYFNLGVIYKKEKKFEQAISMYKKAIQQQPKYLKACYNLGNIYDDRKQYPEAIEMYRKAIVLKPNYLNAFNNLGLALTKNNEFEDAIKAYQRALELNPEDSGVYNNLGEVYEKQGEIKKAIKMYLRAIEIVPNYSLAYNNLGNAYIKTNKNNKAIKKLKIAIEINPNYSEALNNLGVAYRNKKKKNKAIQMFQKAIAVNPNFLEARKNLEEMKK